MRCLVVAMVAACGGGGADDDGGAVDATAAVDDVYCGTRTIERRVDVFGDGVRLDQRFDVASCWRYEELAGGVVDVFERIPSSDPARWPDGICRFRGTKTATFQAELDEGECLWWSEQRGPGVPPGQGIPVQYRAAVTGGTAQLAAPQVTIVADVTTLDLVGDQVIGGAGIWQLGGVVDTFPSLPPGDPTDNVVVPPACALAGCWEGTLTGTVVGSSACQSLATTFGPTEVRRFQLASDLRVVSHDGIDLPGFAGLATCSAHATEGPLPSNQWRYTFTPVASGVAARLHQYTVVGGTNCEAIWEGTWTPC